LVTRAPYAPCDRHRRNGGFAVTVLQAPWPLLLVRLSLIGAESYVSRAWGRLQKEATMKFKCPACPAEFPSEKARDEHVTFRCMFAAIGKTVAPRIRR
jgi:hypothetical protein